MRVTRSQLTAAMILSVFLFGCKAGQALRVVAAVAVVTARTVQVAAAISQANRATNPELESADAGAPSAGPEGKACTEIPPKEGRAPIIVCGGTVLVMDEDGHLRPFEGSVDP